MAIATFLQSTLPFILVVHQFFYSTDVLRLDK